MLLYILTDLWDRWLVFFKGFLGFRRVFLFCFCLRIWIILLSWCLFNGWILLFFLGLLKFLVYFFFLRLFWLENSLAFYWSCYGWLLFFLNLFYFFHFGLFWHFNSCRHLWTSCCCIYRSFWWLLLSDFLRLIHIEVQVSIFYLCDFGKCVKGFLSCLLISLFHLFKLKICPK